MPLQVLDLTNYVHIGNPSMEYIGQIKTLRRLMLANTAITDEGILMLGGEKKKFCLINQATF